MITREHIFNGTDLQMKHFRQNNNLRSVCGKCGEPWAHNHPCRLTMEREYTGYTYDTVCSMTEPLTAGGMDKKMEERRIRQEMVRSFFQGH